MDKKLMKEIMEYFYDYGLDETVKKFKIKRDVILDYLDSFN